MYDILELNKKLLPELKEIAKQLNVKKADVLRKQDLIYKILDEQAIMATDVKKTEKRPEGPYIPDHKRRGRRPRRQENDRPDLNPENKADSKSDVRADVPFDEPKPAQLPFQPNKPREGGNFFSRPNNDNKRRHEDFKKRKDFAKPDDRDSARTREELLDKTIEMIDEEKLAKNQEYEEIVPNEIEAEDNVSAEVLPEKEQMNSAPQEQKAQVGKSTAGSI